MKEDFIKNRIAELLVKNNVSEYKVSRDLGHSNGYLQKITAGKNLPSLAALDELCEYFHISLSDFFYDPDLDPLQTNRPEIHELAEIAQKLSDSDLELLIVFTRDFRAGRKKK